MNAINSGRWTFLAKGVFIAFCAIVAVLFIYEHRLHVLGFLPYLFLLACPLMHIFMHHGHGGHQHQTEEKKGGDHA
jgi:hypothetical protein